MRKPVSTVAAVHDISGVGRCALTVAIPVISAMGAQVCPAPTACLSYHTGFTGKKPVEMTDLTCFLRKLLRAWVSTDERFDCVYTGYLGSPEQAEIIAEFMDAQTQAIKLVDPVMGDEGALYSGITTEMAGAMKALCRRATVITPNLTEYAALTGEEYSLKARTTDDIHRMLDKLDAKSVVITSVPMSGGLVNACRDEKGRVSVLPFRTMSRHYPGTGDLFASVLCGALVEGNDMETAVGRAADFVSYAISISMDIDIDSNYGVQLEAALPALLKR